MTKKLAWDEAKRQINLAKHGLDFADAGEVLESRYRLDIPITRGGELRVQSVSYALGFLAVLTVRADRPRGSSAFAAQAAGT